MVGSAHFKEERKDHQIGESKVYQTRKIWNQNPKVTC